jgi:hypothetical protein
MIHGFAWMQHQGGKQHAVTWGPEVGGWVALCRRALFTPSHRHATRDLAQCCRICMERATGILEGEIQRQGRNTAAAILAREFTPPQPIVPREARTAISVDLVRSAIEVFAQEAGWKPTHLRCAPVDQGEAAIACAELGLVLEPDVRVRVGEFFLGSPDAPEGKEPWQ